MLDRQIVDDVRSNGEAFGETLDALCDHALAYLRLAELEQEADEMSEGNWKARAERMEAALREASEYLDQCVIGWRMSPKMRTVVAALAPQDDTEATDDEQAKALAAIKEIQQDITTARRDADMSEADVRWYDKFGHTLRIARRYIERQPTIREAGEETIMSEQYWKSRAERLEAQTDRVASIHGEYMNNDIDSFEAMEAIGKVLANTQGDGQWVQCKCVGQFGPNLDCRACGGDGTVFQLTTQDDK